VIRTWVRSCDGLERWGAGLLRVSASVPLALATKLSPYGVIDPSGIDFVLPPAGPGITLDGY